MAAGRRHGRLGGYKEVRLIDPATRKPIATLGGESEAVRALAFSPTASVSRPPADSPREKAKSRSGTSPRGQELATIAGHSDCIYAVAFSPDGTQLATASYDKLIKLWDVATGERDPHAARSHRRHLRPGVHARRQAPRLRRRRPLRQGLGRRDRHTPLHNVRATDGVNTIALSPDGKRVAAGGLDKTIRIWRLGDKEGTLENTLIAHEDAILQAGVVARWQAARVGLGRPHHQALPRRRSYRDPRHRQTARLGVRSRVRARRWTNLAAGFFNGNFEIYEVVRFSK